MGLYKQLHIENLNRHKKFCEKQIRFYNEQLIKINKELVRYQIEQAVDFKPRIT